MKEKNGFIYYFTGKLMYNEGDYLNSPVIDHLGRRFSFTKKAKISKIIEHREGSRLMGEMHVEFI